MLGTGADAAQIALIGSGQVSLTAGSLAQQHLDRADDQAERRAQLVADGGEESALELVRLLGNLARRTAS